MAKFHGRIGFVESTETAPGVFRLVPTEREYQGTLLRVNQRWEQAEKLNDDITFSNRISIIADAFANEHIQTMRYVRWAGTTWAITNVEIDVERPRINITIGGVYNV